MYADALLLLFELADREDERFQLAAARWHSPSTSQTGLAIQAAVFGRRLRGSLDYEHTFL